MRSIKPGRGPSGMSLMGSIIAIVFGIFWTILAAGMTQGTGIIGVIFPLFGVLFVIMGIVQAVYHYKNATGKDRFSAFDITDSSEEGDPAARWIEGQEDQNTPAAAPDAPHRYCPYCGQALERDYAFCPACGKKL